MDGPQDALSSKSSKVQEDALLLKISDMTEVNNQILGYYELLSPARLFVWQLKIQRCRDV